MYTSVNDVVHVVHGEGRRYYAAQVDVQEVLLQHRVEFFAQTRRQNRPRWGVGNFELASRCEASLELLKQYVPARFCAKKAALVF